MQAVARIQHQQHPLTAGKLGGFVNQEFVEFRRAAQFVKAQPGVCQPLKRFAQAGRAREVCRTLPRRAPARASGVEPREDDLSVDPGFVEKIAAQPFVAQVGDRAGDKAIRGLQRLAGQCGLAIGGQCSAVLPPELSGLHTLDFNQAVRAMDGGSPLRCRQRRRRILRHQVSTRQPDQRHNFQRDVILVPENFVRLRQIRDGGGVVVVFQRKQTLIQRSVRLGTRILTAFTEHG